MSCTTTTTFAPCRCYDIKYYIDAGSFTLISVDCSGNTIQEVYSGVELTDNITICSQCAPYTAFTVNVQTGDYVTISPRELCVDSQPCPTLTPTPTPVVTPGGGSGPTYYRKSVIICQPQSLCSNAGCQNATLANRCNTDCNFDGQLDIFYCCCNCSGNITFVFTLGPGPIGPSNPAYLVPPITSPLPPQLQSYWANSPVSNGSPIYLGMTGIPYCQHKIINLTKCPCAACNCN